jgi:hypothetical protein
VSRFGTKIARYPCLRKGLVKYLGVGVSHVIEIDYENFDDKRLREILNLGAKFFSEMATNFLKVEG